MYVHCTRCVTAEQSLSLVPQCSCVSECKALCCRGKLSSIAKCFVTLIQNNTQLSGFLLSLYIWAKYKRVMENSWSDLYKPEAPLHCTACKKGQQQNFFVPGKVAFCCCIMEKQPINGECSRSIFNNLGQLLWRTREIYCNAYQCVEEVNVVDEGRSVCTCLDICNDVCSRVNCERHADNVFWGLFFVLNLQESAILYDPHITMALPAALWTGMVGLFGSILWVTGAMGRGSPPPSYAGQRWMVD